MLLMQVRLLQLVLLTPLPPLLVLLLQQQRQSEMLLLVHPVLNVRLGCGY